jgi:hypothetical protein
MREIKFRVWDNRLKKFNYFDLKSVYGNLPMDCIDNVQQFTGLTDMNGDDIYEGDILVRYSFYYVIEWFESSYVNPYLYMHRDGHVIHNVGRGTNLMDILTNDCKITGNILETPDLIKTEI